MAKKVVFWDLETTGLDDDCAATVGVVGDNDGNVQVFHSGYGCEMTVATAVEMLEALEAADTVVTFNGASFDFRVLARVTGDASRVAAVAWKSTDMLFQFAASKGCGAKRRGAPRSAERGARSAEQC
jgi:hypothetical protein